MIGYDLFSTALELWATIYELAVGLIIGTIVYGLAWGVLRK